MRLTAAQSYVTNDMREAAKCLEQEVSTMSEYAFGREVGKLNALYSMLMLVQESVNEEFARSSSS